jgi:hypothetical protein
MGPALTCLHSGATAGHHTIPDSAPRTPPALTSLHSGETAGHRTIPGSALRTLPRLYGVMPTSTRNWHCTSRGSVRRTKRGHSDPLRQRQLRQRTGHHPAGGTMVTHSRTQSGLRFFGSTRHRHGLAEDGYPKAVTSGLSGFRRSSSRATEGGALHRSARASEDGASTTTTVHYRQLRNRRPLRAATAEFSVTQLISVARVTT